MSSLIESVSNIANPREDKMAVGEILLLSFSVLSLLSSCILWSPHKQVWMDEIFTWKEVSDPSLWHLYYAVQHGVDGGQPLFYTTAWLWAKAFGNSVLALRLYSSIAICAALLVTWRTIRRFYGMWATAFGVLFFWGNSGLLLDQNVEARFYGLYILVVAISVDLYTRLVTRLAPTRSLLVMVFLTQAALVLTHVLGLIYGALILLALILVDAAKGHLRFKTYFAHAAGWFALLVWIPAIRASMAAGKPHSWIAMPTFTDLRTAYLFASSLPWLRLFKRHSLEVLFQIVSHAVELLIYVPLAVVFVFGLHRILKSGRQAICGPRGALLLLAYVLLSVPAVLFLLSHLITPVFVGRYFLPSGIGLAVILAASADAVGSDGRVHGLMMRRVVWVAVVVILVLSPLLTVLALGPISLTRAYLDVRRLEQEIPDNSVVVAGWQEDFVKFMRLSDNPEAHYYFLLNWPAALAGPRAYVLDYHLMQSYRNNGYYAKNIQDDKTFLCSHPNFLVLDAMRTGRDMQRPTWFDINIKTNTQFDWSIFDSFGASEVTRKLISVHRRVPLPFCNNRDITGRN